MAQQNLNGSKAGPSVYAQLHHNKPEEHEEKELNLDEDISIEEVLSSM